MKVCFNGWLVFNTPTQSGILNLIFSIGNSYKASFNIFVISISFIFSTLIFNTGTLYFSIILFFKSTVSSLLGCELFKTTINGLLIDFNSSITFSSALT